MGESILEKHFNVTPTYISRRDTKITEQEFMHAVVEFLERDLHKMSKLGDLLNMFRTESEGAWEKSLRSKLIPMLFGKGLTTRKSCENSMTLAKNYPCRERLNKIPDAHFDEVRPLKDQKAQGKLLDMLTEKRNSGGTIPLRTWQEMVRSAKKKSGQAIKHARKSKKLKIH